MNKCKDCGHWIGSKASPGGLCQSEKIREPYLSRPNAPDEVVYSYNEGGDFWVGPEFGCVHWKPK